MPNVFARTSLEHLALVVLAAAAAPTSLAQTAHPRLRVVVEPMPQAGSPSNMDYGRLLGDLIRLRLAQDPAFEILSPAAADTTPCLPPSIRAGTSLPGGRTDPAPKYWVSGHVDARPDGARIVYGVFKCPTGQADTKVPLLQQERAFPTSQAYSEITLTSQLIWRVLKADVPRALVAVRPFEGRDGSQFDEVAFGATRAVLDAVRASGDMEPAAEGRYVVSGTLTASGRKITAAVMVGLRDGAGLALPVIVGSRDSLGAFYDRLGPAIVGWVSRFRSSVELGTPLEELRAKVLLAAARQGLCLSEPQPCARDLTAAASAARFATQLAPEAWESWLLLAQALVGLGNSADAVQALERAARLAGGASEAERGEVLERLGAARFELGDYEGALEAYEAALRLVPAKASTLQQAAEVKWFLGDRLGALEALVNAHEGGLAAAADQVAEHLETLEPADVTADADLVVRACRTTPAVTARCWDVLSDDAVGALRERTYEVLRTLGAVLQRLDPPGPEQQRAGLYAALAASYLGVERNVAVKVDSTTFVYQEYEAFEPDSAAKYLEMAAGLRAAEISRSQHEWIARLRALLHRNRGEFEAAVPLADSAVALESGPLSRWVAAEVRFLEARRQEVNAARDGRSLPESAARLFTDAANRAEAALDSGDAWPYWYIRECYHSLGRDHELVRLLERELVGDSDNVDLLRALKFALSEYLFDYRRGYEIELRLFRLEGASAEDTIDVAEGALLAGESRQAAAWLERVMSVPRETCTQVVGSFFFTWAQIAEGDRRRARSTFNDWRQAMEKYRDDPVGCWVFDGVEHYLRTQSSTAPAIRGLLLAMVRAFEDREAPVPAFPE